MNCIGSQFPGPAVPHFGSAVLHSDPPPALHGGVMTFTYDNLSRITQITMPTGFNDISATWSTNSVTITQGSSSDCLVRVTDAAGTPGLWDVSDGSFSIYNSQAATVTVTAPNGGESLTAGSPYSITWNSSGALGQVAIDYSLNGGLTYQGYVILKKRKQNSVVLNFL